jgi:hypothetical protein
VLDSDAAQAHWISVADRPDAWTQHVFAAGDPVERTGFIPSPDYFPNRVFGAIQSPAPVVTIAPPELEVIEDRLVDEVRSLRVRITSARAANTIEVPLQALSTIVDASVDGNAIDTNRALSGSRDRLRLVLEAPPPSGFELALRVQGSGLLGVDLTDYSNGLPSALHVTPRPPDTMPAIFDFADPTIVHRSMLVPQRGRASPEKKST